MRPSADCAERKTLSSTQYFGCQRTTKQYKKVSTINLHKEHKKVSIINSQFDIYRPIGFTILRISSTSIEK
jgi:hypothetical protein